MTEDVNTDYGMPEPPKSNNRVWIIVLIVVVVLCLCCILVGAAGWWLWNNGDRLLGIYSLLPAVNGI
jgi:hypothetical protein